MARIYFLADLLGRSLRVCAGIYDKCAELPRPTVLPHRSWVTPAFPHFLPSFFFILPKAWATWEKGKESTERIGHDNKKSKETSKEENVVSLQSNESPELLKGKLVQWSFLPIKPNLFVLSEASVNIACIKDRHCLLSWIIQKHFVTYMNLGWLYLISFLEKALLVHIQELNFPFVHTYFKNGFRDTKMVTVDLSKKGDCAYFSFFSL